MQHQPLPVSHHQAASPRSCPQAWFDSWKLRLPQQQLWWWQPVALPPPAAALHPWTRRRAAAAWTAAGGESLLLNAHARRRRPLCQCHLELACCSVEMMALTGAACERQVVLCPATNEG